MAVEGSKMSDEEFMELDNIEIPESIREIANHYETAHCFYKVFTDAGIEWWLFDESGELLVEGFWLE